jgi:hypothetical protein
MGNDCARSVQELNVFTPSGLALSEMSVSVIALSQSGGRNLGIVRLRYATIVVRDYDQALRWYTEVLGLEKISMEISSLWRAPGQSTARRIHDRPLTDCSLTPTSPLLCVKADTVVFQRTQ